MNADPELKKEPTTACTRGSVTDAVTLIHPHQVALLESRSAET